MCDEETKELLLGILHALQEEKYESGGIFTIGGGTGTYQLKSPFNTECEYAVLSIDTNSTTISSFAISTGNPSITAPGTGSTVINYGALALGSESGNPY